MNLQTMKGVGKRWLGGMWLGGTLLGNVWLGLFLGLFLGLWLGVGAIAAAAPVSLTPALNAAPLSAPRLFAQQCAGCHPGGGNIIRRGKTLQLKALVRNQLETPGAIAQLIANGKGNMSAYGDRLSPAQIDALANYVWSQAQTDWR